MSLSVSTANAYIVKVLLSKISGVLVVFVWVFCVFVVCLLVFVLGFFFFSTLKVSLRICFLCLSFTYALLVDSNIHHRFLYLRSCPEYFKDLLCH